MFQNVQTSVEFPLFFPLSDNRSGACRSEKRRDTRAAFGLN